MIGASRVTGGQAEATRQKFLDRSGGPRSEQVQSEARGNGGHGVPTSKMGVDSYTDFETAMYRIQPLPLMESHGHGSGAEQDLYDEQMFHIFMDLDMPGLDTARAAGATNSSEAPPAGSAGRADSTRPGSAAAADGMYSIQSDYEDDDEEHCNERSGGGRARGARSTRSRRRVGRAKDEVEVSSDEDDDASGRGGSCGSNKRVMANRQSAQRSRMRKLQFISDLEANVQGLENDIKAMNPMHSALRQKHAELVSQHDEMRKHAVSLVHKCRQAESVNAALERECSRMRSQRPELPGRSYGMGRYGYAEGSTYGNGYRELQTSGSAPTRPFDRYGSSGGMQGGALAAEASAEPCAYVSSAGVLQVSMAPSSGGQPMKEHHSLQHRPSSAPIGYGQMYEGGSNYSPIYMHAPEPVPY